tara:strand:- start:2089 stop:2637 length:549 start_codon:yes stop_codon:yes gene_type:complete
MSNIKLPRLNISYLDISKFEGVVSAYAKPMPFMRVRTGAGFNLYPLVSKRNWTQSALSGEEIIIPHNWRKQSPRFISKEQYEEKFVMLRGHEEDDLAMVGMKPKEIKAIKVDVPAIIIKNGRRVMVDINDYLIATDIDNKFCVDSSSFDKLFSTDYENACKIDRDLSIERSLENEYNNEFSM